MYSRRKPPAARLTAGPIVIDREGVHQPGKRGALLAHLDEDLTEGAAVLAGGHVTLVARDREGPVPLRARFTGRSKSSAGSPNERTPWPALPHAGRRHPASDLSRPP